MASSVATTERVNWALEQLMAGRGSSAVVSEMSQRWGITRRQAQRLTKRAHQTLVQDLDVVERTDLTAQLIALLMASAEQALKARNSGAIVGISRELRALVGLGADHAPARAQFGRFGRSGTWT
jgi:ABC-type transporter Mla MlaB component